MVAGGVVEYRRLRAIEPELCFLTSVALGTHVFLQRVDGAYQMLPWDDEPGPDPAFWDWYAVERPQWFGSPVEAAEAAIRGWHDWQLRRAAG